MTAPPSALTNEAIWGLPGADIAPAIPNAETFTETPLLTLLRTAAARAPEAIALISQNGAVSYAELLRLAQNAAAAIAARVPKGQPVACLLPRTPLGMAGLIGCLISGRLCLVVDPNNPPDRLATLLDDAAPAMLLVAEPLASSPSVPVLTLGDALTGPDQNWRPDHDPDPDSALVVYFTSGSSGRPKGIVLSARSMLYRSLEVAGVWALTPADRVFAPSIHLTASGLSFLLGALTHGARVVLSDIARHGAGATLRLMQREQITCAAIPTPILRLLFQAGRAKSAFQWMRSIRVAAAALPWPDLNAWRDQMPASCHIHHSYASTEALVIASWTIPPGSIADSPAVPAGVARSCHDYALLDEHDDPVAAGERGELVLRSRYVALGEWQSGQLVPGRMPAVPNRPGWRFYRTGDLLMVRPDGMLQVVGRADRQIKINAIRIEPVEVEAVLRAVPGVTDAVVIPIIAESRTTLHGFIATSATDQAALLHMLQQRLATALPIASRPTRLTVLNRLPMLPSGKIDLIALSNATGPETD